MDKGKLLHEFEEKWGDDLKYVLHEQDVRELFSDISKIMDGISVHSSKKWEVKLAKTRIKPEEKATTETMIEL